MKRRKKGAPKTGAAENKSVSGGATKPLAIEPNQPAEESSLASALRFLRNCCLIAVVVVTPYACMLAYTWYHLQSGITRPVVHLSDKRQVMIFGAQSSGTSAMASELNLCGAEICHESTDAMDTFARDGTISWAHAIQVLPFNPNLQLLCRQPRFQLTHSTQFEPANCSYRVKW